MKKNNIILFVGLFLIVLGILSIVFEQISYTRHEDILHLGTFKATVAKEAHCYRTPVFFGIAAILSGIVVLFVEMKRTWKN